MFPTYRHIFPSYNEINQNKIYNCNGLFDHYLLLFLNKRIKYMQHFIFYHILLYHMIDQNFKIILFK